MPQRGGSTQPPSNDNTKQGNSQEATPPPQPPQPQFDLEAAAFPPLPGDKQTSLQNLTLIVKVDFIGHILFRIHQNSGS